MDCHHSSQATSRGPELALSHGGVAGLKQSSTINICTALAGLCAGLGPGRQPVQGTGRQMLRMFVLNGRSAIYLSAYISLTAMLSRAEALL